MNNSFYQYKIIISFSILILNKQIFSFNIKTIMSYFFQVVNKNQQGIVLITTDYLCEETTKGDLLSLSLPSFYKIQDFYGKWYSKFSLYISNNDFIYEVSDKGYSIASDLNKKISGKYFLIIYATK